MKTVGNDLVRHQLHENRKWYLGLGILLVLFGFVLLATLPFATLSVVFIFGVLMMIGGVLHFIAAFKIFEGGFAGYGLCLVCCIWLRAITHLAHL
jgi:uncharacterized membrane protein HdeD (DUF308 family)